MGWRGEAGTSELPRGIAEYERALSPGAHGVRGFGNRLPASANCMVLLAKSRAAGACWSCGGSFLPPPRLGEGDLGISGQKIQKWLNVREKNGAFLTITSKEHCPLFLSLRIRPSPPGQKQLWVKRGCKYLFPGCSRQPSCRQVP
ncbi:dynactin subunit 6 [Platysternon megacephalum]|uniref:Dynactin subunit 6 n=1 Tax=Platysternon megacephalum TaxID=55544 RepID=A0A4D9ECH1_9SAUR|nr:dynactin subunit 6 [Platysternon megacephalum]